MRTIFNEFREHTKRRSRQEIIKPATPCGCQRADGKTLHNRNEHITRSFAAKTALVNPTGEHIRFVPSQMAASMVAAGHAENSQRKRQSEGDPVEPTGHHPRPHDRPAFGRLVHAAVHPPGAKR